MGIPNLFAVFKIKVYVQIHRRVKITVKKLKTDPKLCNNSSSASVLPSSTHLKNFKATEKEGCHTRRRWQRGNRWWWPWHTATLPQTRTGRIATPGLQECPACLDVLHPRPRRTVGGIGERRCLNWVHRRVAYIHRFREKKMLYRHCAHGFLRSAQLSQFLTIKIGDCIDFYNSKPYWISDRARRRIPGSALQLG